LERTLHVKKNLVNEVKENMDKMHRRLDNIYFEDVDLGSDSPLKR
jgi:hypothetical protein